MLVRNSDIHNFLCISVERLLAPITAAIIQTPSAKYKTSSIQANRLQQILNCATVNCCFSLLRCLFGQSITRQSALWKKNVRRPKSKQLHEIQAEDTGDDDDNDDQVSELSECSDTEEGNSTNEAETVSFLLRLFSPKYALCLRLNRGVALTCNSLSNRAVLSGFRTDCLIPPHHLLSFDATYSAILP
jgi:hypothetical protein